MKEILQQKKRNWQQNRTLVEDRVMTPEPIRRHQQRIRATSRRCCLRDGTPRHNIALLPKRRPLYLSIGSRMGFSFDLWSAPLAGPLLATRVTRLLHARTCKE